MFVDLDQIRLYEGIITAVDDASVSLDLSGRMGSMRFPLRMIITNRPLAVGQKITIYFSYPTVD